MKSEEGVACRRGEMPKINEAMDVAYNIICFGFMP